MNLLITQQLIMAEKMLDTDFSFAWQLYETALDMVTEFNCAAAVQALLQEFGSELIVLSTADPAHPSY